MTGASHAGCRGLPPRRTVSGSAAIAGTAVRLDVHARSTVAWALDGLTVEAFAEHLVPDTAAVVGWLERLPGPVAVAYEVGSTGVGLARTFWRAIRPPMSTSRIQAGWSNCSVLVDGHLLGVGLVRDEDVAEDLASDAAKRSLAVGGHPVAGGARLRIFIFSTSRTASKGDRTCRRGREAPRSGSALAAGSPRRSSMHVHIVGERSCIRRDVRGRLGALCVARGFRERPTLSLCSDTRTRTPT